MIVIGGKEYDIDLDSPAEYARVLQAIDKAETEANAKLAALAEDDTTTAQYPIQAFGLYKGCLEEIFGAKDCRKILGDRESLTVATEVWNDLKDAVLDYSVMVGNINIDREARRTSKYSADKIAKR